MVGDQETKEVLSVLNGGNFNSDFNFLRDRMRDDCTDPKVGRQTSKTSGRSASAMYSTRLCRRY